MIVVLVATFVPFFPGGHDPLAVPLSAIAWALGRVGLLLVPVGGLWLWASTGRESRPAPPGWLVRITIGACILIALVTVLEGFEGKLTTSKWAALTKSSNDTALRDIQQLVERGVLVRNAAGGRSTSYSLAGL